MTPLKEIEQIDAWYYELSGCSGREECVDKKADILKGKLNDLIDAYNQLIKQDEKLSK